MKTLGDLLSDMIRYGDIEEAPWPDQWFVDIGIDPADARSFKRFCLDDPELTIRLNIAATIIKLTHGGQGGSCSSSDALVTAFLQSPITD